MLGSSRRESQSLSLLLGKGWLTAAQGCCFCSGCRRRLCFAAPRQCRRQLLLKVPPACEN